MVAHLLHQWRGDEPHTVNVVAGDLNHFLEDRRSNEVFFASFDILVGHDLVRQSQLIERELILARVDPVGLFCGMKRRAREVAIPDTSKAIADP